jgi:hypothetical protein
LHFRLDAKHRLVYDIRSLCWTLQKCSAYAKFDEATYSSMRKDDKRIVILRDKEGNKYFAKWNNIGTFITDKLGDGFMTWLYSLIDEKLGEKELTIKSVINTFNMIKESISEIIMLSTIFRVKIEMVPVQAQDFERLLGEEKRARRSSSADRKRIPAGGLVGPDTVFASNVYDRDTESLLRSYAIKLEDDGTYEVSVEDKHSFSKKKNISAFTEDGAVETIDVKNIGPIVGLRGRGMKRVPLDGAEIKTIEVDKVEFPVKEHRRPPGRKKKQKPAEPVADNTQQPLNMPADGEQPKKRRGRPPGSKNKSTLVAVEPVREDKKPTLQPKPSILKPKISSGLKPKVKI